MFGVISVLSSVLASLFKSRMRLEAENLALRHQLEVLAVRRRVGYICVAGIGCYSSGSIDCGRES